ncbi:unnamed protein product [Vicia faba]|uniref:Uncharacterized protein n=1 Tax=Vicia faba TaxID=3906 RepID=A0AAV0YQ79_VICFA|nr:unnamed protein product [Vicia faba]
MAYISRDVAPWCKKLIENGNDDVWYGYPPVVCDEGDDDDDDSGQPERLCHHVNNTITENNVGLDNAGTAGHNTVPGVNMPGPSNYRDEATTSSSSMPPRLEEGRPPPLNYPLVQFHEVPVPAGTDATTRELFAAINQTNYLISSQGERLRALEDDRRPPRRHRRPQSPPPRQADEHP